MHIAVLNASSEVGRLTALRMIETGTLGAGDHLVLVDRGVNQQEGLLLGLESELGQVFPDGPGVTVSVDPETLIADHVLLCPVDRFGE